jgi:hypothetical protein
MKLLVKIVALIPNVESPEETFVLTEEGRLPSKEINTINGNVINQAKDYLSELIKVDKGWFSLKPCCFYIEYETLYICYYTILLERTDNDWQNFKEFVFDETDSTIIRESSIQP